MNSDLKVPENFPLWAWIMSVLVGAIFPSKIYAVGDRQAGLVDRQQLRDSLDQKIN